MSPTVFEALFGGRVKTIGREWEIRLRSNVIRSYGNFCGSGFAVFRKENGGSVGSLGEMQYFSN